ncbi:hypothetical protein ACVWXL_007444 [Bradyrhizobium sp. GM22.5]
MLSQTQKAGIGPAIAVTIADDLVGEIELDAVEPAVLLDMRLVAVSNGRDMLQRDRHLRRRDVAQFEEHADEFFVAGGEADAQARQVRALGQRLERDHAGEIRASAFERAAGRFAGVDLRIALVAEDHEAVAVGELLQANEIIARGHRSLRVGGRGQIERHRARQRRLVDGVEIGQEAVLGGGRQVDRLASSGAGAGAIDRIERVRHQDRGLAGTRADIARSRDGGEEQPLAAAIEDENLALGIERSRQLETRRQPGARGQAERVGALVRGVTAEIGDVLGQYRADEIRHRMLRLADGKRNQRLAGLMRCQQLVQPDEGRAFAIGASTVLRRTG